MKIYFVMFLMALFSSTGVGQNWEKMTEAQLKAAVPEKAPVIKENIETEFRTASGITSGTNQIFGVIIITAGYEADGKFTHFLRTQALIKIGAIGLRPDDYVFGYKRFDNQTLRVMFYRAKDGKLVGETKARVEKAKGPIYSFLITPPELNKGKIYIGRFSIDYVLE